MTSAGGTRTLLAPQFGHGGATLANPALRSKRSILRSVDVVARVCRAIWPHKTSAELARRTGVTPRAAEYWLARGTGLSADHLADLLRSDAGLDILEGLIGDARPVWWRAFKRTQQLAALRRGHEEQRKLIERLEREAAD